MPALIPGTKIIRLTNSSTGRQIFPGMVGVVGGLVPNTHDNSNWSNWSFERFPVQWQNYLWSSLAPEDEGDVWKFAPALPNQSSVTNQMHQIEDDED